MVKWLEKNKWRINSYTQGREHGYDIDAEKGSRHLLIEAKGAKPCTKPFKHEVFTTNQIWSHFGVAVIKVLYYRHENPKCEVGIAQPDNKTITDYLYEVVPEVKKMGIKLFWVDSSGHVRKE